MSDLQDEAKRHLHPEEARALDVIDAALFTGDPGESAEKLSLLMQYIERWKRKLDETYEDHYGSALR